MPNRDSLPRTDDQRELGALHADRVEVTPLRAALDWASLLIKTFVDVQIFRTMVRLAGPEAFQSFDLIGLDGVHFPVDVKVARDGDAQVVLTGPGFFCRVFNPRPRRGDRGKIPYGVEVQVQGMALAASRSGADVVRWFRDAVIETLFAHLGPSPQARRDAIRSEIRPGRWDVAIDVLVRPRDPTDTFAPDDYIEENIFRGGHLRECAMRFVTKARTPRSIEHRKLADEAHDEYDTRQQGKESTGRTFYLGNALETCVYEKDKHKAKSTKLALNTLRREFGWNGEDRVVRWEMRVDRAWMHDQQCDITVGGELQRLWAAEVCFDDWLDNLPAFAAEALSRTRHVDLRPGWRRRDCKNSTFYEAVRTGLALYRDDGRSATASMIARIIATQREASLKRSVSVAAGALVRVAAILGVMFGGDGFAAAAEHVVQYIEGQADHFEQVHRRTLLRHRMAEGIALAELIAA